MNSPVDVQISDYPCRTEEKPSGYALEDVREGILDLLATSEEFLVKDRGNGMTYLVKPVRVGEQVSFVVAPG